MIKSKGIIFILRNWKLIVHLLWKTNRFGVNNQRSSSFDSMFGGWSTKDKIINTLKIKPILFNYKFAKYRATSLKFLSGETCKNLGWKS